MRTTMRRPVLRMPGRAGALTLAATLAAALAGILAVAPADAAETKPRDVTQQLLNSLVGKDGLPGALGAVSRSGGKVGDYTAGVGDLATGAKVPTNGYIRIASNTKTYTAVAVLQLVGEGQVDLDAKIERYLPGLVRENGNDGRKITVRQLLQQTSGLPDYDEDIPQPLTKAARTYQQPRALLDSALSHKSHFAPGSQWEYSNTNYVLAGLLVEKVTGRPIGEEITRRIIKPLRLKDTYWPNVGDLSIRNPHPKGYFAAAPGEPWVDITAFEPSLAWAAGALVSTPRDALAFFRALIDGKLLKPEQLRQMQTVVEAPGYEPTGNWSYGLGLAKKTLSCGVVAWGHGGDAPGYESRGLATTDGRGAFLATTALPTSLEQLNNLNAAVETAVCQK